MSRQKKLTVYNSHTCLGKTYQELVRSHERQLRENQELMAELNSFDPQFFEDLEDLKYNYREVLYLLDPCSYEALGPKEMRSLRTAAQKIITKI